MIERARRLANPLVAALAVVLACAALLGAPSLRTSPVGNHDVAAIAGMAERFLHGDRLYVDRVEVNPPVAIWAEALPLALARAAGWDAMTTIQWAILAVCAGVVALFAWACETTRVPESATPRVLLVGLVAAMLFGFENYELGQRDPMVFVATLPYLVGAAGAGLGRPLGGRVAVAAGAVAALALALKPQFVALPIAVEIVLIAQTRSLRTPLRRDALVMWAVLAGVGAWVLLGTRWLPEALAWKGAYRACGALGTASREVLFQRVQPTVMMWAVPLLALRPGDDDPGLRRLTPLLLLAALAASASAFAQGMGFSYHLWPVKFLGWLVVGVSAARWWPHPVGRVVAPVVVGVVALHTGVVQNDFLPRGDVVARTYDCPARAGLGKSRARCRTDALIAALRERTEPGDRVALLAPTGYPFGWALVGAGVVDAVTVPAFFVGDLYAGERHQAAPVAYHPPGGRGDLEERLLTSLAGDLERHEPRLVVVDHRAELRGLGRTAFDLLAFHRQDPRVAALLDAHYVEVFPEGVNGAIRFFERR